MPKGFAISLQLLISRCQLIIFYYFLNSNWLIILFPLWRASLCWSLAKGHAFTISILLLWGYVNNAFNGPIACIPWEQYTSKTKATNLYSILNFLFLANVCNCVWVKMWKKDALPFFQTSIPNNNFPFYVPLYLSLSLSLSIHI